MKKNLRSNNPENVKPKPRKGLSFKELVEEFDEIAVIYNNKYLFSLVTNYNSEELQDIFRLYPDKEYPMLMNNNIPIVDKNGEVIRDKSDLEISTYNRHMSKLRMVSMLRLMSKNIVLPEENEEAISVLEEMGSTLFYLIENKIQETIIRKTSVLKEVKDYKSRELLAFSQEEKIWLNRLQHEKGIQRKTDNRQIEFGITNEFLMLELAEKYNWPVEFQIRALKNKLTEEEECLIALQRAKYELEVERENRIHKEYESRRD